MADKLPIGLVADVHMHSHTQYHTIREGFNSRLLDARDVILHIGSRVLKQGGRSLIVVGDWFHHRKTIPVPVLHTSEYTLLRLRDMGLRVYCLVGNHDLTLAGDARSVGGQPFEQVWDEPGVHSVDGWRIAVVPWTDDPAVVRRGFAPPADLCLGHFGIGGSKIGPSDFEIPGHIDAGDCPGSRLVFLGHYHKPQTLPGTSITYIGSPLQLTWGERGERKRFVLVHPDGRWGSTPLASFPRFVRTTPDKVASCRPQDFVEVVIDDPSDVTYAQNAIERAGVPAMIRVAARPQTPSADTPLSGKTTSTQVETYVDDVGVPPGVPRSRLIRAGLDLIGS